MKTHTLIFRYILFSIFAIASNIFVQRLFFILSETDEIFILAFLAGTGVGLFVKYFLDKHWIFYFEDESASKNGRTFLLYASTGIFTTLLFWVTEYVFWFISQSHQMREVGAVLGLTIGYYIKYHLDSRYTFASDEGE